MNTQTVQSFFSAITSAIAGSARRAYHNVENFARFTHDLARALLISGSFGRKASVDLTRQLTRLMQHTHGEPWTKKLWLLIQKDYITSARDVETLLNWIVSTKEQNPTMYRALTELLVNDIATNWKKSEGDGVFWCTIDLVQDIQDPDLTGLVIDSAKEIAGQQYALGLSNLHYILAAFCRLKPTQSDLVSAKMACDTQDHKDTFLKILEQQIKQQRAVMRDQIMAILDPTFPGQGPEKQQENKEAYLKDLCTGLDSYRGHRSALQATLIVRDALSAGSSTDPQSQLSEVLKRLDPKTSPRDYPAVPSSKLTNDDIRACTQLDLQGKATRYQSGVLAHTLWDYCPRA